MVFLADLPFFHCARPARICVEGQGLTKAFELLFGRVFQTNDLWHSPQTESASWCPLLCVASFTGMEVRSEGGGHWLVCPEASSLRQG